MSQAGGQRQDKYTIRETNRSRPDYLQSEAAGRTTGPLLDPRGLSLRFFSASWSSPSLKRKKKEENSRNELISTQTIIAEEMEVYVDVFCNKRWICPCCGHCNFLSSETTRLQHSDVTPPYETELVFRETPMRSWRRAQAEKKKRRRKSMLESLTPLTGAESNPSSISHAWVNLIGSAYCYHFLRFIQRARQQLNDWGWNIICMESNYLLTTCWEKANRDDDPGALCRFPSSLWLPGDIAGERHSLACACHLMA